MTEPAAVTTDQITTAQAMARSGWTDFDIAARTGLPIEQVRRLLPKVKRA
ncbi:hypothetical protein [Rhodovarius crocodyli]|nr:hypothetical protein [Rhodovarius crocodyli]